MNDDDQVAHKWDDWNIIFGLKVPYHNPFPLNTLFGRKWTKMKKIIFLNKFKIEKILLLNEEYELNKLQVEEKE
jgi:hypothetical protein